MTLSGRLFNVSGMRRSLATLLIALGLFPVLSFGQHAAADPGHRYFRVIALVHLTGSGKKGDPILPEYVPAPGQAISRDGIVSWSAQLTDDGKMAIVHLVAVNHSAFNAVFADARPEVKVFEIGKVTQAAILAALAPVKASLSLNSLNSLLAVAR